MAIIENASLNDKRVSIGSLVYCNWAVDVCQLIIQCHYQQILDTDAKMVRIKH